MNTKHLVVAFLLGLSVLVGSIVPAFANGTYEYGKMGPGSVIAPSEFQSFELLGR